MERVFSLLSIYFFRKFLNLKFFPECPYECIISDAGLVRARGDALTHAQHGKTARFEVSLNDTTERGELDVLVSGISAFSRFILLIQIKAKMERSRNTHDLQWITKFKIYLNFKNTFITSLAQFALQYHPHQLYR